MQKSILTLLGATSSIFAAQKNHCAPEPPVSCNPDDCKPCYCLGPENTLSNAPVCPVTCNGDWKVEIAGFYWNAHQDGMEFAIKNKIEFPSFGTVSPPDVPESILATNNLIDAEYENPHFKWDVGFKAGLGYCTTCDGWEFGVKWTWYRGKANHHVESEPDDNTVLLPLYPSLTTISGGPLYASDIQAKWELKLNLIDLDLGRNYWTSKYLALRPFMGLRVAYLNQHYRLEHRGGSFDTLTATNFVDLHNDFHGVGVRGGLDTTWNLGCGWGLYGNLAATIAYGKTKATSDETTRSAATQQLPTPIAQWKDHLRLSRSMLDLSLGLQWMGMLCDCQYGIRLALGWEHHIFFDQNQMWRVSRLANPSGFVNLNLLGENDYKQTRGTLDTQGWTFTVDFSF